LLPSYAGLPPKDFFPQARAAAERALELDRALAEAHASLGWVKLNFDWTGAARKLICDAPWN